MNKRSKIYIAGHTGLVGSALHRCLVSKGYKNIIIRTHKELDLTDQSAVEKFFKKERPEYVFLAAAKVGGIAANNTYRADFIYQNIQIQNNIIHQSYVNKVKKLLFLGSSCIYPRDCPQPIKEEYLLTGPLEQTNEPYAIAKIAGIKMCESYNLQYGTNFISVMPTNLFGPQDNFNLETSHVLPAIIRKMHLAKLLMEQDYEAIKQDFFKYRIAQEGKYLTEVQINKLSQKAILSLLKDIGIEPASSSSPITHHPSRFTPSPHSRFTSHFSLTLWGSGTPRREFLYSDDLADACVYLMEKINFTDLVNKLSPVTHNSSPVTHYPSPFTSHINIGMGKDQTIAELADLVKKVVGFKGQIAWDKTKPDGTPQKLLDVSKLHKLGWKKKVTLEQGIKKVYDTFKIQSSKLKD